MPETITAVSSLNTSINTGLSTMTINVSNGNLLDTQVAEALAECYERGIKPTEIMNALNSIKK